MQSKTYILIIGISFSLLLAPASIPEVDQSGGYRFTVRIMINEGNERRLREANMIVQALQDVGIGATVEVYPFATNIDLFFAKNNSWDMWIVGFAGGIPFGNLYDIYACDGFFGYYQGMCNTTYQEQLELSSASHGNPLTQADLDRIYDTRSIGFDLFNAQVVYDDIQRTYMEEALNSVPLVALQQMFMIKDTVTNYSFVEDPVKAVFRGAIPDPLVTSDTTLEVIRTTGNTMYPFDPLALYPQYNYVFLPTLFFTSGDGLAHPNAAVDFKVSDWVDSDGVTWNNSHWSFTLRDDMFWVDPVNMSRVARVTATDFKYGFEAKAQTNHYAFSDLSHIEVNDTLNTFDAYFRFSEPNTMNYVVGEEGIALPSFLFDGNLTNYNGTTFKFGSSTPVTDSVEWSNYLSRPLQAGPYIIAHNGTAPSVDRDMVTFVKNPFYWYPSESFADFDLNTPGMEQGYFFGSGMLGFDKIIMSWEVDSATALQMFDGGTYDVLELPYDVDTQSAIIGNHTEIAGGRPMGTGDLLMLNMENPHLNKYDVRRAIAMSIDKVRLNTEAFLDMGVIVDSPLFISSAFYTPNYAVPYDVYGANQMLDMYYGTPTTTSYSTITSTSTSTTITSSTSTSTAITTSTSSVTSSSTRSSVMSSSSSITSETTSGTGLNTTSENVTSSFTPPPPPLGTEWFWIQILLGVGGATVIQRKKLRRFRRE